MPDISKSVQLYQLAVDEAKVRLDLAVVPGTWLMPSRMVMNAGSVVGYNNQLKQAGPGMNVGLNNDVNQGTKKSALHLMAGRPSKVNAPNSHPSNPIHKAAHTKITPARSATKLPPPTEPVAGSGNVTHNVNKVIIAVNLTKIQRKIGLCSSELSLNLPQNFTRTFKRTFIKKSQEQRMKFAHFNTVHSVGVDIAS